MLTKLSLAALAAALACLFQAASAATLPPVVLAWNQNPEPDIAGYEVKYGTVSGVYGTTVSAGLDTSVSVSGLTEGVTYYFVLIAINKDGLRSGPVEISYTGTIPTTNEAPQSTISDPPADIRIAEGEVVYFSGSGSDPNDNSLTYLWNFGSESGISDSSEQSPGTRIFNTAGTYLVSFTAIDSLGQADPTPATRTIIVAPRVGANQAPESTIITPSSNVSITAGQTISFSGSGTDPDRDTALTYLWNFGGESGIADFLSPNPGQLRFDRAGTYVVTLTVSDSLGLADPTPATRTITVLPPVVVNQAPDSTISRPASDTTINIGESVYFSGNGSDPDDRTPFTYLWNFGSGSGIDDSTSRRPRSRRFNIAGTHVVTFTVTNSLGLADPTPATRTITVLPPVVANQAPESTISSPASDISIVVGGILNFSGSGIDPDGDTSLTYRWNFGNDSGFVDSTSETPGIRRFNTAGTYVVTLTVSDSMGLADPTPATRTITVSPPNQAPESTISEPPSDVSIAEGGVIYFSGSGSDPDGDTALTYHWNFGSESGIEDANVASPGTRIFDQAGTYLVTFIASDSLGLDDQTPATRTITVIPPPPPPVANQAPESTISEPLSDVTIIAGQSVRFAGNGDDPDGNTPLAYVWSIGTGSGVTTYTERNPGLVQFDEPGVYGIILTVTDADGLADPTPATRTVIVLPPPPPSENQAPESMISEPPSDITISAGESVIFAGSGDDPDGDMPLSYRWNLPSRFGRTDPTSPNPGVVWFWNSGTYEVSLTVTDAEGLADATPAKRIITVVPQGTNLPPDSTISAPSSDVIITAGQSVDFAGTGTDPDGNTPLAYLWSFGAGSGIIDSTSRNPGSVRFGKPGIYQVSFSVTDSKGLVDPSPAQCTVTVNAGVNRAPFSMISKPASNLTITAGESVTFSGVGDDPDGDSPLTYLWNFPEGSGIENSTAENPGSKQFDTPGTYEVSFTVTDSKGLADSTPAVRTVIVLAAEESVPGLEGWITSPESDLTISVGETVWFTGSGVNNYRWGSLNYLWNFGAGSGIPDSMEKRPEAVRFNNPGTYVVTFTVINPKGLADPSPARVTITVTGAARLAAMGVASEVQPVMARETIDGASYLTFTVTKPLAGQKFDSIVEVSSDLKTWHSDSEHLTIITDDERTLKVRTKNPISGTPCCFFRLKTPPQSGSTTSKPEL